MSWPSESTELDADDERADSPDVEPVASPGAHETASPDDAPPPIDVEEVTVRLGDVTALEGVSTTVERGRFVGLVGPNGAGKTTLLRAITGAVAPERGAVRLDGEDVHGLSSRAASRKVAVVAQDTHVGFDFDVREVVAMGRTPYVSRLGRGDRAGREAVARAMERTEVAEFADRSIGEVSGGERQRILLARALAQETPVLLLDEPTASLDINHQARTLELVRDLVEEGMTVIAAIHDLNLAAHYCDELLLLGDGRALARGPPESVLTEDNLEAAFGTSAAVTRHPVTGSVSVTALPERPAGPRRGRVHVVGGGGNASRLVYLLDAAGYEVSVGALNRGDADLVTAHSLGVEAVTVEPFAPVDEEAARRVEELAAAADVAVVADVEVGTGNLPNLRAARAAPSVVVVEDRPFEERNYAGEEAATVYDDLQSSGTVVAPEGLLGAVADLGGDDEGAGSGDDVSFPETAGDGDEAS